MKQKLSNQKNERLIKSLIINNTKNEVYMEEGTLEDKKRNLKNIYDTINDIARKVEKRGVDTSSWFYTHEQIEAMKKDSRYNFI